MSENFAPGTIPTDSLVITRKVMTGSSSSLETLVCEEAQLQELHVVTSSVKTMKKFTVDLVGRDEYAKAKTEHPNLTYWSVGKLVNDFNQEIHAERNPLTDYLSHVSLGEVVYEEVEDGKFKVGFTFGDEFRQRLAAERTQSIDTLLDMAELPPTDNFRNWRNEKKRNYGFQSCRLDRMTRLLKAYLKTLPVSSKKEPRKWRLISSM